MEPVQSRSLKLTFRDPASDPITDVAESNTVHKPRSHFDDHEEELEKTGSCSSARSSQEDDSELEGGGGSSSDRRQPQLNCNDNISLTTAVPGPVKSPVKKNLMFPSAGDMHSSVQQYMAVSIVYRSLHPNSIKNESISLHRLASLTFQPDLILFLFIVSEA
jgi:hypothetical protein